MRIEAFLLTRQWRDVPSGIELTYWAASTEGPLRLRFERQHAVCFAPESVPLDVDDGASRRRVELRTLEGEPVDALYFDSRRALLSFAGRMRQRGLSVFESDIKPSERFLMERFLTGGIVVEGNPTERDGFLDFESAKLHAGSFRPSLRWLSVDIETDGVDGSVLSIPASRAGSTRCLGARCGG